MDVGQLMKSGPLFCYSEDSLEKAAGTMADNDCGCLVVKERSGALVGLITEYDLLQLMIAGRELGKVPVEQVMSAPVLTVTEDKSLVEVADLFQDRYVTRVPVVRGSTLVGIVARRDLLFGYLQASTYWS